MSLWWLQPGWRETPCACCGAKIWPEGDPDMGICFACYSQQYAEQRAEDEYYSQLEQESANSTWEMYRETMEALSDRPSAPKADVGGEA